MELRPPVFIVPLTFSSEIAFRTFQTASKTLFDQTTFLCPMKTAIDLSVKSKPPLIHPPHPEALAMEGNKAGIVISNWLANQQKKPAPKPQPKRSNTRKGGRTSVQVEPPPPPPVIEYADPCIVFITDYPRTIQQLKEMVVANVSVVCHLTVDAGVTVPDTRKQQAQTYANYAIEWGPKFEDELPFLQLTLTADKTIDQQWKEMCSEIRQLGYAFLEYQKQFMDVRYITIPKFPQDPILIPAIPQEKSKKANATGPLVPEVSKTEALSNAYKAMVLQQLETWRETTYDPIFSKAFQHAYELLPQVSLAAHLSQVLSFMPNFKAPEIFIMRSVANKENVPYDLVFRIFSHAKFEELVGTKIPRRLNQESVPLELVSNLVASLSYEYSRFEWTEFAGKLLLSFFHDIPKGLPIATREEKFHLPVFCGFKRWLKENAGEHTYEKPEYSPKKDAQINVGSEDQFLGFDTHCSESSVTSYFDESGMRIDSYPAVISNGMLSQMSFTVSYGDNHKFSFSMSQKSSQQVIEEEEEEGYETVMTVRGLLSRDSEILFEHDGDTVKFSMFHRGTKICFDVATGQTTITGNPHERKRIMTRDGKIIRFCPHPIIYSPDGSIQEYIKGLEPVWKLVSFDGKGYVKKGDQWFREPKYDTTSQTISTHFATRKVTNRSDGLSFIEDENNTTIVFPDGTQYDQVNLVYTHPDLPTVTMDCDKLKIEMKEFCASFSETGDFELITKDDQCCLNYFEDIRHIMIQYGKLRNVLTMVDLITGMIANVGARKCVYYLAEDWTWKVARHLCSRKEVIQHFRDGDLLDRLSPCTEMEKEEIEEIILNGHKPRLFLIDKEHGLFEVSELLDDRDFKKIEEQAFEQRPKTGQQRTFWFGTDPKTFRQMKIFPEITQETLERVQTAYAEEIELQARRKAVRESVLDDKWRVIRDQELDEESQMVEFYNQYGVEDPTPENGIVTVKRDPESILTLPVEEESTVEH